MNYKKAFLLLTFIVLLVLAYCAFQYQKSYFGTASNLTALPVFGHELPEAKFEKIEYLAHPHQGRLFVRFPTTESDLTALSHRRDISMIKYQSYDPESGWESIDPKFLPKPGALWAGVGVLKVPSRTVMRLYFQPGSGTNGVAYIHFR